MDFKVNREEFIIELDRIFEEFLKIKDIITLNRRDNDLKLGQFSK